MKLRLKILSVTSAVLLFASCSKEFLDVNNNPNAVTDVPTKLLLPTTIVGMGFANSNELGKAAGLLMHYNAGILGLSQAYDRWNINSFDGQWQTELYVNTVNNLGIILQKNE